MATTNATPLPQNDLARLTVAPGARATGNVLLNDSDPEHDPLHVATVRGTAGGVGVTLAGSYGSLTLRADGTYDYVVDTAKPSVQALAPGSTISEVFRYTVSDGFDHTTSVTTVTNQNLITRSEAFDAAAWLRFQSSGAAPGVVANVAAGPNGGAATADQLTLAGANRGIYFNTDVAGTATFSVWVRLVSGDGHIGVNYYDGGTKGLLTDFVATGQWQRLSLTFSGAGSGAANVALMHNAAQTGSGVFQVWGAQLNPGGAPTDYLPTAGAPATTTVTSEVPVQVDAQLVVSISGAGTANAAPQAKGDTAAVGASGPGQAAGNVLANDNDPEHDALVVTAVNGQAAAVGAAIAGAYGSLVLGASGDYTYVLGAGTAVQALAPGQVAIDSFSYTISDGLGHAQVRTVIAGENLITRSEAFDNPAWVRFGPTGGQPVITANAAAAPLEGLQTADRIMLSSAGSGIYYQAPFTGECTFSVWVRLVSGDGRFGLNYYDGGGSGVFQPFVATGAWQRVSVTFNGNGVSADNVAFMHGPTHNATGVFEIWGAQLNRGDAPTGYAATHGHYDKVYAEVAASQVVTGSLNVTVEGPRPDAGTSGTLTFAGGSDGVIVDLRSETWSHALKVLSLGDSISLGNTTPKAPVGSEAGYRTTVWWQLAGEGSPINFVGTLAAGDANLPDKDHFTVPGYRSDQLAAALPGLIGSTRPDAILLMAGANDVFEATAPVDQVVQSLSDMIATVTAMSPQTHLYVATLTPISPTLGPVDAAMVGVVNAAIRETVGQAAARGANVSLVDTSSIKASDLADFAHLTAAGYGKLGQLWAAALRDQAATGRDEHVIGAGVVRVIGTEANDMLIGGDVGASLQGGGGVDALLAGRGQDALTGGSGGDLFVVGPTSGRITITDFNPSQQDHIVLEGYVGLSSFAQLAAHTRISGGGTIIDFSAFGSDAEIVLSNYTRPLSASDMWIL
jgi:VCBS repeat-containing protein